MSNKYSDYLLKNGWHVLLPSTGDLKIQVVNEEGNVVWERLTMKDIPWPKYWQESTRSDVVEASTFLYVNGDNGVQLSVACSFAPLQVIFDMNSGRVIGVADAR